jgi:hypothetical protein
MRRSAQLQQADRLAQEVLAFAREYRHPLPDGMKKELDFRAMVTALGEYLGEDLSRYLRRE